MGGVMGKYLWRVMSEFAELFLLVGSTLFVRYMLEISTPAQDWYMIQLGYSHLTDSVRWAIRIPDPLEGVNKERLNFMRKRFHAGGYTSDATPEKTDTDAAENER